MGRVDEAVVEFEITGPGFTLYQYALTDATALEYSTAYPPGTDYIAAPATTTATSTDAESYAYSAITFTDNYGATHTAEAIVSSSNPSSAVTNNGYAYNETAAGEQNNNGTTSQIDGDSTSQGGSGGKPQMGNVLAGVFSTIFTLAVITTIVFCCKRRRARRRLQRQEQEYTQSRPAMQQSYPPSTINRRSLTRDELYDVVPLPPPLARYSRIIPSRAPALPPRNGQPPTLAQLRSNRLSTVSSSWADDSEIDALATDGSTIARTISTHSVSSRLSEGTAIGSASDNPFDHPAYTLMTGTSRRTRTTNTGSGTLISSGRTTTDILSPTYDPFSDSNTPLIDHTMVDSPISPISPAHLNSTSRSGLDEMFGGDLERGATIIQHIDGGRALPQRAALPEPDRLGDGEVHIPPTYMELYPGRNGR